MSKRLFRAVGVLGAVLAALFGLASSGLAAPAAHPLAGENSLNLATGLDERISARTAPNTTFDAAGYLASINAAQALPASAGTWTEIGPYNYFTDDPTYADPTWSNSGSGDRYVSGRITSLAATADGGVVVAGGADGGLWRSTDRGTHWTPVGDHLATLSIGSLAVDETSGCVFIAGTGEANTSSDSYAGVGFYRSVDCGLTWTRVGPDELNGALIWHVRTDPNQPGQVWAGTSRGVYVSQDSGASWTLNFKLDTTDFVGNQWTDVIAQPGTQTVVGVVGWRNGDVHNGIYVSRDGGGTWGLVANPQGWVPQDHQGRVTFAYSADGTQLYAIDEDPTLMLHFSSGTSTLLGGVFNVKGGDPAGPYNQIASSSKLMSSGSAETVSSGAMKGYQPGVQAWYNQFLAVDPADSDHVYLGLEEVYETLNGGSSWNTVAPYWNLTLPCFSYQPFEGTCDRNGAHSDQHAAVIAAGTLWVGNDGGVYSRSLGNHNVGQWTNLNQTLGTLQFYSAAAGQAPGQPLTYYGGLQDNGTAKVIPGQLAVQPFGGDGGATIVDPGNPDNVITEYVYLTMARSNDGGHHWTTIAPSDPHPRFIAPFGPDRLNPSTIVAGGEKVWVSTRGYATTSADWQAVYDTGAGHSITALDSAGGTAYAAWCGPCNPHMTTAAASSASFQRGISTNAGGAWHALAMTGLPNRFVSGVAIDPRNGSHAWVTFSGYSRNWIVGPNDPGTGHVFETTDGGNTWADRTNGLVDSPVNALLVTGGHLVVSTDIGVFADTDTHGTGWHRLGTGLPTVVVDQLTLTPAGTILAATHGRGLWTIPTSAL